MKEINLKNKETEKVVLWDTHDLVIARNGRDADIYILRNGISKTNVHFVDGRKVTIEYRSSGGWCYQDVFTADEDFLSRVDVSDENNPRIRSMETDKWCRINEIRSNGITLDKVIFSQTIKVLQGIML